MSSLTSLNQLGTEAVDGLCSPSCSWKVNVKYIPLKIIYFCYMAGQGGSVVFRSLFIKHVGMSTTQNGIIWAVDRVFGIFVPPMLGAISDKSGKPRATIIWLLITGALACASLCLVPSNWSSNREQSSQQCYTFCSFTNSSRGIRCAVTSLNQSCLEFEENTTSPCYRNSSSSLFTEDRNNVTAARNAEEFKCDSLQVICQNTSDTNSLQNSSAIKQFQENLPVSWQKFQNMSFDSCNCSNNATVEVTPIQDVYGVTFWSLLTLLVLSSISVFAVGTLVDSFVISSLSEKQKHKFGQQRLWGGLGFGASTLLVGFIKDIISESVTDPTSNISFYPFFFSPGLFWIILCVTMGGFTSHVTKKEDEEKIRFKALKVLLMNPRILAFLIFTVTLGITMAVCEIYMFWLAEQQLQASSTILAASIAFSTCFEIVAYLASGSCVRRFGPRIMMTVGLLVLGTRLILYTLVTEAWHLLFAEVLRGLGWPTVWISVCHHTTKVSPPGLAATTMGLVQATTFGVGYGIGALLGGYLFQKYGGNAMFRIMFMLVVVVSLLYVIFYRTYDWCHRERTKAKDEEKPRNEEEEKLKKNNPQQDFNHNVHECGDFGSQEAEKKRIIKPNKENLG